MEDSTVFYFFNVYKDLPEFMKEDNRGAAKRICEVLSLVGLYLKPDKIDSHSSTLMEQIIEDNITLLAEAEHDGWMDCRIRNGWRLGDTKEVVTDRIHPLLIPYQELSENQKEKDRNAVRKYAKIVAKKGYHVTMAQPNS